MERALPKDVFARVRQAVEGKAAVRSEDADCLARALREWAAARGATSFCHWFQPLTGLAAEKHDAFIDWGDEGGLIEKFTGKMLLRGEPDASSFPSGGIRCTSEARGYTSWDPTTPPFLWKSGGCTVLCIPSIFFSWGGQALDMKIPLLRSDAAISQAALRLLRLLGIEAQAVYSTLGCEQEYFLVDRALYALRPDLMLTGRTLFGTLPAKGQELEDHYFGTVPERVLAFMRELEEAAYDLGIPIKTRHGEVAPGQYESAPIFARASLAVDHNILLMELMRQVAVRHDLVCLLHEKPFAGINGSGKHNNWSLSTDTGMNLLDPTAAPESSLLFLSTLAAVLSAVHTHAALLRASIASAGNDHRLGGHEAPPAIMSVYLGEALERVLDGIERGVSCALESGGELRLGIPHIPSLPKDSTDRNRTSPFAFTGNKFEFRSVGASAHCALPITVLNSAVAESLHRLVDEIEGRVASKPLQEAVLEAVSASLQASKAVRFSGNNYSPEWAEEARRRGLPVIPRSFHALSVWKEPKTVRVFEGVLDSVELEARRSVWEEQYSKVVHVEAKLMVEMVRTQVLPAALEYLGKVAPVATQGALRAYREALDARVVRCLEEAEALEAERKKAALLHGERQGQAFCDLVTACAKRLRAAVDELEMEVSDPLWPLPKYRELLYLR
jgi:glutamine synthetase